MFHWNSFKSFRMLNKITSCLSFWSQTFLHHIHSHHWQQQFLAKENPPVGFFLYRKIYDRLWFLDSWDNINLFDILQLVYSFARNFIFQPNLQEQRTLIEINIFSTVQDVESNINQGNKNDNVHGPENMCAWYRKVLLMKFNWRWKRRNVLKQHSCHNKAERANERRESFPLFRLCLSEKILKIKEKTFSIFFILRSHEPWALKLSTEWGKKSILHENVESLSV